MKRVASVVGDVADLPDHACGLASLGGWGVPGAVPRSHALCDALHRAAARQGDVVAGGFIGQ